MRLRKLFPTDKSALLFAEEVLSRPLEFHPPMATDADAVFDD